MRVEESKLEKFVGSVMIGLAILVGTPFAMFEMYKALTKRDIPEESSQYTKDTQINNYRAKQNGT